MLVHNEKMFKTNTPFLFDQIDISMYNLKKKKKKKKNSFLSVCISLNILDYYIQSNQLISLVGRMFSNGPGDLGSIPVCVIPKTLKMVSDTSLLNT